MFGIGKRSAEPDCPWFKSPCRRERCTQWIRIEGTHPQTGQPVDHWDCTFKILPMLLIEASQQVRGVQAATESFRNEVVRNAQAMQTASGVLTEIRDRQAADDQVKVIEHENHNPDGK